MASAACPIIPQAGPSTTANRYRLGAFDLGAGVQNRTAASLLIWDDRRNRGATAWHRIKTMLFTIAVLTAVGGALLIHRVRAAGRANQANLGWMSAQWLAEHRASHLS